MEGHADILSNGFNTHGLPLLCAQTNNKTHDCYKTEPQAVHGEGTPEPSFSWDRMIGRSLEGLVSPASERSYLAFIPPGGGSIRALIVQKKHDARPPLDYVVILEDVHGTSWPRGR